MTLRFIRMALPNEALDQLDHLPNERGRTRLEIWLEYAKRTHILHVMLVIPLGNPAIADTLRFSSRNDLVIDVRDVACVLQAVRPELAPDQERQRVENNRRPGIADMSAAVDRGPAHIHGDALRVLRDEFAFLARHRVIQAEGMVADD